MLLVSLPKIPNKNIILKIPPIIEPSLWILTPSGITIFARVSETPIFLAASIFTGIQAALEQVANAVTAGGVAFFQNVFTPCFLPAI